MSSLFLNSKEATRRGEYEAIRNWINSSCTRNFKAWGSESCRVKFRVRFEVWDCSRHMKCVSEGGDSEKKNPFSQDMTPQCLMCLSETSKCLIFLCYGLEGSSKRKKNLRVKMNFHYQPLTLWCKCVYHISQGEVWRGRMKSAKTSPHFLGW